MYTKENKLRSQYTNEPKECLKAEIEGEWTTEEGREFRKVIVLGKKEYKRTRGMCKGSGKSKGVKDTMKVQIRSRREQS